MIHKELVMHPYAALSLTGYFTFPQVQSDKKLREQEETEKLRTQLQVKEVDWLQNEWNAGFLGIKDGCRTNKEPIVTIKLSMGYSLTMS